MSARPYPNLFPTPRGEPAFGLGPDARAVGASQWASLGRGLTFVLLLAASLLGSVYVPQALHGPEWVEGTATARTAAR